jgi:hypothetical protein
MLIDPKDPTAQPLTQCALARERAETTSPVTDSVSIRVVTWKFRP